jgi:hypothetical protein
MRAEGLSREIPFSFSRMPFALYSPVTLAICRSHPVPESATQAEPMPRNIRGMVLLALYVAMTVWVFSAQSTSWPHEGSWAAFAYLFLCPGIVFQTFALIYARLTRRPLKRRALARVATIPLGLVIAAVLGEWGSTLAMGGFERAYTPFAAQVGANLVEPCGGGAKYFAIPAVAAYNGQAGRQPTANLKYDGKRFVVSFSGGSFDIDGSTIYFDSDAKRWHKFHNDSTIASQKFEKLTEGLAECKLRSAPLPQ